MLFELALLSLILVFRIMVLLLSLTLLWLAVRDWCEERIGNDNRPLALIVFVTYFTLGAFFSPVTYVWISFQVDQIHIGFLRKWLKWCLGVLYSALVVLLNLFIHSRFIFCSSSSLQVDLVHLIKDLLALLVLEVVLVKVLDGERLRELLIVHI